MIGGRQSAYYLMVAIAFVAVLVIAGLAWKLGQNSSRTGRDYGCFECGRRGKRHELYQRIPGLDGVAFHFVVHFFLAHDAVYHIAGPALFGVALLRLRIAQRAQTGGWRRPASAAAQVTVSPLVPALEKDRRAAGGSHGRSHAVHEVRRGRRVESAKPGIGLPPLRRDSIHLRERVSYQRSALPRRSSMRYVGSRSGESSMLAPSTS